MLGVIQSDADSRDHCEDLLYPGDRGRMHQSITEVPHFTASDVAGAIIHLGSSHIICLNSTPITC